MGQPPRKAESQHVAVISVVALEEKPPKLRQTTSIVMNAAQKMKFQPAT